MEKYQSEKLQKLFNLTKKVLPLFLAFFLNSQKMEGQILPQKEETYYDSVLLDMESYYKSPEVFTKIKNFFIDLPNSEIKNPDFVAGLTIKNILKSLNELNIQIVTNEELKKISKQYNKYLDNYAIIINNNIYINEDHKNTPGVLEHEVIHYLYKELYGIISKSGIFYFVKKYEPKKEEKFKAERINFLNYLKEQEELSVRIMVYRNNLKNITKLKDRDINSVYIKNKLEEIFKKYQTSNLIADFLSEKQEYFIFINTIKKEDLELLEILLALDLKNTTDTKDLLIVSEKIEYLMQNLP